MLNLFNILTKAKKIMKSKQMLEWMPKKMANQRSAVNEMKISNSRNFIIRLIHRNGGSLHTCPSPFGIAARHGNHTFGQQGAIRKH
jgi:hypothetical protein